MMRLPFLVLMLAVSMSSQAALIGRAPLTPGSTDYQAHYDDALNITWLADANLSQTSGYDADGLMTWTQAQTWVTSLTASNYLGLSNWRLPSVTDSGPIGCNFAYSGTDCGFSVDISSGEMANLYYGTLGNSAGYSTGGTQLLCDMIAPPKCLTNAGPFANIQTTNDYWYGTEYASVSANAWRFGMFDGAQTYAPWTSNYYAWAVHDGDPLNTPVPGAVWLLGGALGLLKKHTPPK